MNGRLVRTAILCGALLTPSFAAAAAPFDGAWDTVVVCAVAPDGAKGYSWRFTSHIANGSVTGQYGQNGAPNSGSLTGSLNADGSGLFEMAGLTGGSSNTLGYVKVGTPYSYRITVHFTGSLGTGQRNAGRVCTVKFSRM